MIGFIVSMGEDSGRLNHSLHEINPHRMITEAKRCPSTKGMCGWGFEGGLCRTNR